MTTVRGGGDDFLVRDYTAPAPLAAGRARHDRILRRRARRLFPDRSARGGRGARRRHPAGLGAYRVCLQVMVDRRRPRRSPSCRFFGKPGPGPYAHFYTIDADECALVAASPGWIFEGLPFSEDAAGRRRLRGRPHPCHAPVQQLHERPGRAPLPDEPQRDHCDGRRRLARTKAPYSARRPERPLDSPSRTRALPPRGFRTRRRRYRRARATCSR